MNIEKLAGCKRLAKVVIPVVITASAFAAPTATTGFAVIGGAGLSAADNKELIEVYKSCPANRRCEYPFLAYSFVRNFEVPEPQDMPKTLIKAVVPTYTSGQVLVIRVYLDSGANRKDHPEWCYFRQNVSTAQFWNEVRNYTDANPAIKNDWVRSMAVPAGNWIRALQTWASTSGFSSRLQFVVVPVLEDGIKTSGSTIPGWAYQRLVSWTQPSLPAGVSYARNSAEAGADRIPALSMEYHITDVPGKVPDKAMNGDLITNDGVELSDTAYGTLQTSALNKGISAADWFASFNNNTGVRSDAPWQRVPLKPFTNDPGLKARMKMLLISRPPGK